MTLASQSRTYFIFAALNLIWIPVVYLFYPETKDRSLESIESMFGSSPFYWQMEKAYAASERMREEKIALGTEVARQKNVFDDEHKESEDV